VNLANALRHSDSRRALDVYDHTLRHLAEVKNNSSFRRFEVSALVGSTYPLRRLGCVIEARQRLDAAFERLSQLKLYPSPQVKLGSEADDTLRALADYKAGNGSFPRAIEIYRKLLEQIQAAKPDPQLRLEDALVCRASTGPRLRSSGRPGNPILPLRWTRVARNYGGSGTSSFPTRPSSAANSKRRVPDKPFGKCQAVGK
jgi:hypothetical protein